MPGDDKALTYEALLRLVYELPKQYQAEAEWCCVHALAQGMTGFCRICMETIFSGDEPGGEAD